jgi:hypothetical protein
LDCESSHVRNDASTFVLGVAGIKPTPDPNINLNIEMRAGYVIDLTGRSGRVVDVTPAKPANAAEQLP